MSLPPPASPDSPSPSPSHRPFSLLPTELVQYIIESTVPLHYDSATYNQRQKTLRSLSLVSRLFRQIANPLLFTIVNCSSQSVMNSWWAQDPAGNQSRRPTELVASIVNDIRGFEFSMIQLPSLRLLALGRGAPTMDLSVLTPLSNLKVLRLSEVSLKDNLATQLPSVIELQLLASYSEDFVRILTPKTFPALQAFSYSDDHYHADGTLAEVLTGLTPQLDALSLDARIITKLPEETIRAIENFTLFDLDYETEHLPIARHIRIINAGSYLATAEGLQSISDSLESPTSLRLLYLPVQADIAWDDEELESAFRGRGVEIVKEEQPRSWPTDACISSDFWRRMKEAKRKGN